jgi:23S rRNA pseudouridine1911/1915/1917 synthase
MQILFEDNHCLVVNKTAGLPTQAPSHVPDSEESYVRGWLMSKKGKTEGKVYLGIPHRLDRPVSGVLLFAKSSKAAARLAEQFRDRQVEKTYWALVPNTPQLPPDGEQTVWSDHLAKVEGEARGLVVPGETPGAKNAESLARILSREEGWAHLEVKPQTGRMHQIRLQCAHRGFPILGDITYGSPFALASSTGLPNIALHARKLIFLHPIRYEPITIEAPVPADWDKFPIGDLLRHSLGLP